MPDLKGRLTEGTPGGNGLVGVRLRLVVERAGHRPGGLTTVRTGEDGEFTASARVDSSRTLQGTLVVRSDERARSVARVLHDWPDGLRTSAPPSADARSSPGAPRASNASRTSPTAAPAASRSRTSTRALAPVR